MAKPSKVSKKAVAERKYLTTGLLLIGASIGLGLLTVLIVLFADQLPIIVPIGAAVLLLIGCGSIMRWMLGDKIEWD